MCEQLSSNEFENDDFNLNTEESDYKNLITKLKEINITIDQLEIIFR